MPRTVYAPRTPANDPRTPHIRLRMPCLRCCNLDSRNTYQKREPQEWGVSLRLPFSHPCGLIASDLIVLRETVTMRIKATTQRLNRAHQASTAMWSAREALCRGTKEHLYGMPRVARDKKTCQRSGCVPALSVQARGSRVVSQFGTNLAGQDSNYAELRLTRPSRDSTVSLRSKKVWCWR